MEVKQERVIFNDDSSVEVQAYDVDGITDLPEGEMFGIIASKYDMDVVSPVVEFMDGGVLEYALSTFQDVIPEEIDIDSDVLSGGEDLPLIFKKIKYNLAQELLTGKTFIIGRNNSVDTEDFDELSTDIKWIQQEVETYKDNNVLIYCDAQEVNSQDKTSSGLFVVNDGFKALYNDQTLSKKEEVIKALNSIHQQAKAHFDSNYKKCIDVVQGVANTDNLLYDLAHPVEDKPKTM